MHDSGSKDSSKEMGICDRCGKLVDPHDCEGVCPHCFFMSVLSPAPDEIRGTRYGPYEISELIAEGGMGRVYRARHVELNRLVAIKILAGRKATDSEHQVRFRREAEAVARLNHPNIVPIFEVGEVDGQSYFSMRLIDGPPLHERDWKRRKSEHFVTIAEVMAKIAEAVHNAHLHGILHRDIKPGNVLIDPDGEPHLTDFGLARFVEDESDMTRSGAVLGTPQYMAPEQIDHRVSEVNALADVYGLGAILYEMLTGMPPFNADSTIALLRMVSEEPAPKAKSVNGHVPIDLETIASRCLEKEPSRRYGSAHELAVDLRRFVEGRLVIARPIGAFERLTSLVRRRPLISMLIFLMVLLLLALAIGGPVIARNQVTLRELAESAEGDARATATLLTHQNYQFILQVAKAHIEGGNAHRAPPLLWQTDRKMRGWEWGYLMAHCPVEEWSYDFEDTLSRGLALSADGRRLFYFGYDGFISCFDVPTRSVIWRFIGDLQTRVALDPKQRSVAVTHSNGQGIEFLDFDTGVRLGVTPSEGTDWVVWGNEGDRIYVLQDSTDRGRLLTLDGENFRTLREISYETELTLAAPLLQSLELDQSGETLVGTYRRREVVVIPLDHPSQSKIAYEYTGGAWINAVSAPSLNGPGYYSRDRELFKQSLSSRDPLSILETPHPIRWLFHPNDSLDVVLACTMNEVYLVRPEGAEMVARFPETVRNVFLQDDGRLMTLSTEGVARVHRVDGASQTRWEIALKPGEEGRLIALNDDGSTLVYQDWRSKQTAIGSWERGRSLRLRKVTSEALEHQFGNHHSEAMPILRPNSNEIVTRAETGFRFYRIEDGQPEFIRELATGEMPHAGGFDASGMRFIYTVGGRLRLTEFPNGRSETIVPRAGTMSEISIFSKTRLAVHSSGDYVALSTRGQLRVVRVSDGSVMCSFDLDTQRIDSIAVHPFEHLVAYGVYGPYGTGGRVQGVIFVREFETGAIRAKIDAHPNYCHWLGFSPDGRRLVSQAINPALIKVWDWAFGLELIRIENRSRARVGAFSGNGLILASTDYDPGLHLRFALPWDFELGDPHFYKAVQNHVKSLRLALE